MGELIRGEQNSRAEMSPKEMSYMRKQVSGHQFASTFCSSWW